MSDAALSLNEIAEATDDATTRRSNSRVHAPSQSNTAYRTSKLDALLCAQAYSGGVFSAVAATLRLRGAPYRAKDAGMGFDQCAIALHAYQAALLSLSFLLFEVIVVIWPGRFELQTGQFGTVSTVLSTFVLAVIVCVQYWLPRVAFRDGRRGVLIPGVADAALWLRERLFTPESRSKINAVYFAGERPFVGYGTEVNSWTLVVDTSASAGGVHDLIAKNAEPAPLDAEEMYQAVIHGIDAVGVKSLRTERRLFVDGFAVDAHKRLAGRRYCRPSEWLPLERVRSMDSEATTGRDYLMLQMQQPEQDILVTLFMRFYQEGKLIFCEFSSYVLPPGSKSLYRLGHLFHINGALYTLYAVAMGLVIGVASILGYLVFAQIVQTWIPSWAAWLTLPAQVAVSTMSTETFQNALVHKDWGSAIVEAWNYQLLGYAVIIVNLAYVCLRALGRGLSWLFATLGILFNVSRQFGIAFSYRERFSSRASLKYYALQEVVRFLKIQEKILVKSVYELLKERGIDTSDFKESLTAYINQGVINSGDIRGSVFTRVKSFVGRRPVRAAAAKRPRLAVANG